MCLVTLILHLFSLLPLAWLIASSVSFDYLLLLQWVFAGCESAIFWPSCLLRVGNNVLL